MRVLWREAVNLEEQRRRHHVLRRRRTASHPRRGRMPPYGEDRDKRRSRYCKTEIISHRAYMPMLSWGHYGCLGVISMKNWMAKICWTSMAAAVQYRERRIDWNGLCVLLLFGIVQGWISRWRWRCTLGSNTRKLGEKKRVLVLDEAFLCCSLLEHGTYRLVCPRLILIDANKRNIISSDYKLVSRFHMSKLRWQEFWNIDRLASSTLVQYSLSTKLDDKILRNWGVQMCQLMFIYTYFCDDYQIHNLS